MVPRGGTAVLVFEKDQPFSRWQVRLQYLQGFKFQGGHEERYGVDANGQVIAVPLHKHKVSLDFWQIELAFSTWFSRFWSVEVRIPYEIKDQKASIDVVEAATEEEVQAMLRNGYLHHRTKVYHGLGDVTLLLRRQFSHLGQQKDLLLVGVGFLLPTGEIEPDPYTLGDAGQKHLHIQFGTGTFTPWGEVYYVLPFEGNLAAEIGASGRFPFYENRYGFLAPREVSYFLGVLYSPVISFRIGVGCLGFYQSFGYWSGRKDPNTGILAHYATGKLQLTVGASFSLWVDIRFPFAQEVFSKEGDAFEQNLTFSVQLVWSL